MDRTQTERPDQLEELVAAVLSSRKYRSVSANFVSALGARELPRRASLKAAIKATKNKLHQVSGVYLEDGLRKETWLQELRRASQKADREELRRVCLAILGHHISSRERLPFLDQFYPRILADQPPPASVLDLACGLNPLAIPWLPLAEGASYYACDVYDDLADFLNAALPLLGVRGESWTCDLCREIPSRRVDLVLLLKTLPCLEQVDRAASLRLLDGLDAAHLLVSYPAHSLGGHKRAMVQIYEAHLRELLAGRNWSLKQYLFPTEVVFLLTK